MTEQLELGLPARLLARVAVTETGCWQWTGGRNGWGYGVTKYAGRVVYVHRLAYELTVGPIPDGLQIDHLCRNRLCVKPKHLEPVTQRVNILRGQSNAAANAKVTHCPQGHEYSPDNTYVMSRPNSKTYRLCATCKKASEKRRRDARRAAA